MASGTIPLSKLIQYSLAIEATREDGDWFIYYYAPDGVSQYKIKLDAASVYLLKKKRDQILEYLNQTVTLSGEVVETWKFEEVTIPAETKVEWVKK